MQEDQPPSPLIAKQILLSNLKYKGYRRSFSEPLHKIRKEKNRTTKCKRGESKSPVASSSSSENEC
jgi:hypothetical protein